MNDLIPDPLPDAREWKREIFLHVDALINPPRSAKSAASTWSEAWSWRYGKWGRDRPDVASYVDLLVFCLLLFFLLEITSYNAYALKFQQWVRTAIFRRPQLDVQSVVWEEMIYRIQVANEGSLKHAQVFAVDPFEGLKPWEDMYGMVTVRILLRSYHVVLSLLALYIVWFFVKYWSFVLNALFQLYIALYMWLIRTVLSTMIDFLPLPKWLKKPIRKKVRGPSFSTVMRNWRNDHVNPWIRTKMMGYLHRVTVLKEKTIGRWKRTLVEEPARNVKDWYDRFHKVHVDLSYLDFLRLVVALHPIYASSSETAAFMEENGAPASMQRFFTVLSKALHWARKKKERAESKKESAKDDRVPAWWHYLPVLGLYLLLGMLFVISIGLWIASMGHIPLSWDHLRRAMAGFRG